MIDPQPLINGAITIIGRHPGASNAVFLVSCESDGSELRALYKPVAGERPLWDFPRGELARREVAAYELAKAWGATFVPTTVWRDDGPLGPGSLQRWIEDVSVSDVAVVEEIPDGWLHVIDAELTDGTPVALVHRDDLELRTLALFDAVINNGDRKGGHILRDAQGSLFAVDHGVSFHEDPKLRTVLWGFEGMAIDGALLDLLDIHIVDLPVLRDTLTERELDALEERRQTLRRSSVFPAPSPEWPSIPWPVY